MSRRERKPATKIELRLLAFYVAWAVGRQIAHDVKTLWRLISE